jgi:hypothetical protein
MLGSSRLAAQLEASEEGLSSVSKYIIYYFNMHYAPAMLIPTVRTS